MTTMGTMAGMMGDPEQIGESGGLSPAALKLTPARLQKADQAGYERLSNDRKHRESHIRYWLGRWYGSNDVGLPSRPLNLMAQMMMAFGVQIVPQDFKVRHRPLRSGLTGEAKILNALVDNNLREQEAGDDVFAPAVLDALVSPFATIYTGLRVGRDVVSVDGADIDPGEPFSQFIEFDDVAVDPSAKDMRRALWFRHRMRIPRHWLLESPAFAASRDIIAALPAFEDGSRTFDDGGMVEDISQPSGTPGHEDALFDTVELLNFVIFDHGRIIECCVPPLDNGPPEWLRREEWYGPDRGPYDWLSFWRVPGNLTSLSPASVIRDVAEKGDILFNKISEQAENSKKVLGFKRGSEEDAEAIAEAEDGKSTGLDDPGAVQVFDLQMVAERLIGVLGVINQGYQDLAGNPALLSGSAEQSQTLGQDQILNMRAGARVSYMSRRVVNIIRSVVRKWSWYYQSDPSANYEVPVDVPGVGPVPMKYGGTERMGKPADYRYDIRLIAPPNADPNMQAEQAGRFLDRLVAMAPYFMPNPQTPGMPPLFKLRGIVEELAPKYGIENPEDIINDMELEIERLVAEQSADAWLARASAMAPDLAGPGPTPANPMAAPVGIPPMPGGVTGSVPRPMSAPAQKGPPRR